MRGDWLDGCRALLIDDAMPDDALSRPGDSWLERKGKFNPPGPEQRRNRQNLFETFQEGSNPYKDGRTLGDQWLEHKGKG